MSTPDGFVPIADAELQDVALNTEFTVDEFSPFVDPRMITSVRDELIVDHYYGQVYHAMELEPAGIYGRTSDLPVYSGDELANHGFLRVPFRRIPRRVVRNRTELETILRGIRSADPSLRILLRGQTREYTIRRASGTSQWLYGEDSVLEPSLQTSAARRRPPLEEVLPEWCTLLRLFLAENEERTRLPSSGFSQHFGFPLFALALAQHYGLPTAGLDLTDRLDVALFFALMKYQRPAGNYRATYAPLTEFTEMPVLYLLSVSERQQFEYEQYRAEGFPWGRPDAQSARFMHIGWGYASNACARRIFLALYLDPAGHYDPIPTPADLFPGGETDRFAAFLEETSRRRLPETLDRVFKEGFYTVEPA